MHSRDKLVYLRDLSGQPPSDLVTPIKEEWG
jgi:hypothetical protein